MSTQGEAALSGSAAGAGAGSSTASTLAYLSRVLKTPTIGRVWEQLAETAREEGWSHQEYLAAVLQRQVADREASGTRLRIAGAHFPALKSLEDFNVVAAYRDLWKVEQSFRMAKSDLRARPIFHRTRDSIEAHLTIVFAALAVARDLQEATGTSIRKTVRTLRKIHTAVID